MYNSCLSSQGEVEGQNLEPVETSKNRNPHRWWNVLSSLGPLMLLQPFPFIRKNRILGIRRERPPCFAVVDAEQPRFLPRCCPDLLILKKDSAFFFLQPRHRWRIQSFLVTEVDGDHSGWFDLPHLSCSAACWPLFRCAGVKERSLQGQRVSPCSLCSPYLSLPVSSSSMMFRNNLPRFSFPPCFLTFPVPPLREGRKSKKMGWQTCRQGFFSSKFKSARCTGKWCTTSERRKMFSAIWDSKLLNIEFFGLIKASF